MTTIENNNIKTEPSIIEVWRKLWELANSEISWCDGVINFNSFFSEGEKLFEVKLKEEK